MKSVWVIEQGQYSDYRVVGVFSSRENAELVAKEINAGETWDKATLAERPLDPVVDDLNAGRKQYRVHMLKDGTTERAERYGLVGYDIAGEVEVWRRSNAPAYRGKGIPDVLVGTVWADSDEHAIKIMNEHRTRMIAEGKF